MCCESAQEGEKQQQQHREKNLRKRAFFCLLVGTFLLGPPPDQLNFWPSPLQRSVLLHYPILQTITGHKIDPTEAFLPPDRLLQGVSRARLLSYIRAGPSLAALLTWQESDLQQTIKDCQRRQTRGERCQHTRAAQTFPQLKQYPANGNTRMSARTADNRCCVATGSGLLAALSHTY